MEHLANWGRGKGNQSQLSEKIGRLALFLVNAAKESGLYKNYRGRRMAPKEKEIVSWHLQGKC